MAKFSFKMKKWDIKMVPGFQLYCKYEKEQKMDHDAFVKMSVTATFTNTGDVCLPTTLITTAVKL